MPKQDQNRPEAGSVRLILESYVMFTGMLVKTSDRYRFHIDLPLGLMSDQYRPEGPAVYEGPLLLTWINLNTSIDK